MKLYERDFKKITTEEEKEWDELKQQEAVAVNGKVSDIIKKPLYRKYPSAIRHYLSLFPNNFLDPVELINNKNFLLEKIRTFECIINEVAITERDILTFINKNEAYFIIGSILKRNYQFGHHSAYVFSEFKLPPNFQVDYLVIGQNSDGHHFIFIELENPYGRITRQDGSYGDTIRKGISQVDNWELWLEQNFSHLRLMFENSLNDNKYLPKEFSVFDKTRMHYVVIAGRRNDYNAKTYRLRRVDLMQRGLKIFHYDNLIDFSIETIGSPTY
jgi:hypothetical protein